MKEIIVQIKNLKKNIGKKTIIDDISFDIYRGEIFGFLGPNGAGKTTTIRMMVGLMSITEGDVVINGYSIKKNFEKAISHVGGIVENPEMYKYLTGYQNLVHYARMVNGVKPQRILEVVELVGLKSRIHDKVKTYSLGMRQRLGVAQALLHHPSLLILDEPTNGLDPAGIKEFRDYLKKLAKEENIAIMVSSHLLSEIEQMCDRIGIIQKGRLVDVKQVSDFLESSESREIVFKVNSSDRVKEIIHEEFKPTFRVVSDDKIQLTLVNEDIPRFNKMLVNHDIDVYGIYSSSKSLEERFLEITGGEQVE